MIKFWRTENKIIFTYTQEYRGPENWVKKELESTGQIKFKKTFHFSNEEIHIISSVSKKVEEDEANIYDAFDMVEYEPVHFYFAELIGEYYKIIRGILIDDFDIYFHKDIEMELECFVVDNDISLFGIIASITTRDIYLGGNHKDAIPLNGFFNLLASFPNNYEKKKYVQARIASILRQYVESFKDAEASYHKYMNKKISKKGADLKSLFRESELAKYETILAKLQDMLGSEDAYSEKQWQEEIVHIPADLSQIHSSFPGSACQR